MTLEGRKFHFARDEDGHIYAENEIETEIANREGWLLPPRKGEKSSRYYAEINGSTQIEVTKETTGELSNGQPVYTVTVNEIDYDE